MYWGPAVHDGFQLVIEEAVFAATSKADDRKAVLADLVNGDFLSGTLHAHPGTNVQRFIFIHFIVSWSRLTSFKHSGSYFIFRV